MLFNAAKDAPPIFKERFLWLLLLAPFFFLLYGGANQIVSHFKDVPSIAFGWESQIPFIAEMIVPYMLLDLFFGLSFLIPKTRQTLQQHAVRLGFTIAISMVIFILYPLQFTFEKPEVIGWLAPLFEALKNDLPYNQLPSLHVSLSMVVGYQFIQHSKGVIKVIYGLFFSSIIVSVLFVYQHHFIDIPSGVLIGFLAFFVIPKSGKQRLCLNFVSPKHIGMAIKYLIVAIIAIVCAFKFPKLCWLFAWLGLSMLLLSTAYALGINRISHKKNGKLSYFFLILFWPYFLGSFLTWKYWHNKLSSLKHVDDDLLIGMSLGRKSAINLDSENIKTVIDLAPELNSHVPLDKHYYFLPLLDLSIPDPNCLMKVVEQIEQSKKHGKVLVHCKLGLSRSVMVAGAWLIAKKGFTAEKVWSELKRIQPRCPDRTYMLIALQLFEAKMKDELRS